MRRKLSRAICGEADNSRSACAVPTPRILPALRSVASALLLAVLGLAAPDLARAQSSVPYTPVGQSNGIQSEWRIVHEGGIQWRTDVRLTNLGTVPKFVWVSYRFTCADGRVVRGGLGDDGGFTLRDHKSDFFYPDCGGQPPRSISISYSCVVDTPPGVDGYSICLARKTGKPTPQEQQQEEQRKAALAQQEQQIAQANQQRRDAAAQAAAIQRQQQDAAQKAEAARQEEERRRIAAEANAKLQAIQQRQATGNQAIDALASTLNDLVALRQRTQDAETERANQAQLEQARRDAEASAAPRVSPAAGTAAMAIVGNLAGAPRDRITEAHGMPTSATMWGGFPTEFWEVPCESGIQIQASATGVQRALLLDPDHALVATVDAGDVFEGEPRRELSHDCTRGGTYLLGVQLTSPPTRSIYTVSVFRNGISLEYARSRRIEFHYCFAMSEQDFRNGNCLRRLTASQAQAQAVKGFMIFSYAPPQTATWVRVRYEELLNGALDWGMVEDRYIHPSSDARVTVTNGRAAWIKPRLGVYRFRHFLGDELVGDDSVEIVPDATSAPPASALREYLQRVLADANSGENAAHSFSGYQPVNPHFQDDRQTSYDLVGGPQLLAERVFTVFTSGQKCLYSQAPQQDWQRATEAVEMLTQGVRTIVPSWRYETNGPDTTFLRHSFYSPVREQRISITVFAWRNDRVFLSVCRLP